MKNSVNVLGTRYSIKKASAKALGDDCGGTCDADTHEIEILDLRTAPEWENIPEEKRNQREAAFLRHEITHAFFNESGLQSNAFGRGGSWACNEEMVDWIALQGPKLYAAWLEAGCV